MSDLRARVVETTDFERFDLVLAMDEAVYDQLRRVAPRGHRRQGPAVPGVCAATRTP